MKPGFDQLFPTLNTVTARGTMRTTVEDFEVIEQLQVDFSGEGEHLWLWVEKTGNNTNWVAQQLAKACRVSSRAVGYAGLKDRHAVTRQWFSVQLPKVSELDDLQSLLPAGITLLEQQRHQRKLKTGGLLGNRFRIVIRNITGEHHNINDNLARIRSNGVPNYFGEQRFGHGLSNVARAESWFAGEFRPRDKKLQGLLLSAARSWIFNHIVAERIRQDCWIKPLPGDIFQLHGSHSWFQEHDQQQVIQRLDEFDIHITGALWGDADVQTGAAAAELETRVADQFPVLQSGLQSRRLQPDRRAMRMLVGDLEYTWCKDALELQFTLSAGSYATAVLREIVQT